MPTRLIFLTFGLLSICSAQDQHPHRSMTIAEIYGFHGPIHTQKSVVREIEKDPRVQPKLHMRFMPKGWMAFNQLGQLIEEGELDQEREVKSLVRHTYGSDGEEIGSEISDGEKVIRYNLQKTSTPDGSVEVKTFRNDKLLSSAISTVKEGGTGGETTVIDADGATLSHTRSHRDGRTELTEVWAKDGRLANHSMRRLDNEGNTVETSRYDQSGRLVSVMSFNKGELTSFWQDPACNCTNGAGFNAADGSTVFYKTEKDGTLYKEVQHHSGRPTNHLIDDHELYDQNGQLLEKIAYTYTRDAHGNWTKRTVLVLAPNTNSMVAVEEDTRELSYY